MKILKHLQVPTGDILVVNGDLGKLEMLSLGDYGKDVNIRCDALGLNRDPSPVRHTELLPLTEKWVITISTQYGCSMGCTFCDVPKVGGGRCATFDDLIRQVLTGVGLHPDIKESKRLNVHFARMGEPTWNPNVLDAAKWMHTHLNPEFNVHPVVSTMMPRKNQWLKTFVHTWMRMKNRLYQGNAGLQLSINSTNQVERDRMFHGNTCTFPEIRDIMHGIIPSGRKITLNFAVAHYEIDPDVLLNFFNPRDYIIKLTPMHMTKTALGHGIYTQYHPDGDYTTIAPYKEHEQRLKSAGYDVLVFIASREEDLGRITCGNAILSGTLPEVHFQEIAHENQP
jgi:23S rRNA (adenine2503-C2)-methyltransferase